MKYLILTLLLISCTQSKAPHVLGKYELSTNKEEALKQCNKFFKKFHGKYTKVKSYGVTERVSTLQFYKQPDCAVACETDTFYWDCTFSTNDDSMGFMDFLSTKFEE